jgi:hypothetical protein
MSATFTYPERQMRMLVETVARQTRQSTVELMNDVMRLWSIDLMRETWPKSASVGKKAVLEQISAIFTPYDKETESSWIATDKGGANIGMAFKTKTGAVYSVPHLLVDTSSSQSKVADYHQSQRDKRSGRVRRSVGKRNWKVGNWEFVDKFHATQASIQTLIKEKQAHVGRLAAGWVAAASHYGVTIPGWISRHGGSEGSFKDALDTTNLKGTLEASNNVPYAGRKLGQEWLDFLLRKRVSDLTNGYYVKRWQKKMESVKVAA